MKLYTGENQMFSALFGALDGIANEHEQLSASVNAATGGRDAAITALMETADDPKMTKLREAIAKATEQLRSLAEGKVSEVTMSPEDLEKAKEKLGSLKTNLRNGYQAIEKLTSLPEIYVDDAVKEASERLKKVLGARSASTSGNTGSGIPKARVSVTVQGGNFDEPVPFPNLSTAAAKLGLEVTDLLKAYADAAGVEFDKVSSVKTVTTFTVTPKENGATYTVVTTPKVSAPKAEATPETTTAEKSPEDATQGQEATPENPSDQSAA